MCFAVQSFFFKTVRAAVKIVISFVLSKNYLLTIQLKASALYSVSASSDTCAEKASVFHIAFQCIVPQNHIRQSSLDSQARRSL